MNNKNLIGKKLEFDNCSLFQFSNVLYDKEIIIVDMEMNGHRGKKSEIIEFYGAKVKKGIVIDIFGFKCKHTKYEIHKELIEKKLIDLSDYDSRHTIDFYIDDLTKFLENSVIFLWGSFYDRFALINLYRNFKMKQFLKKIKYIDFQYCLKLTNPNLFGRKSCSLNELFNSLVKFYEEQNIINEDFPTFISDIKVDSHFAKDDVLKLIFLVLGYGVEITYGGRNIDWIDEIRNIQADITFYRDKKKNTTKKRKF